MSGWYLFWMDVSLQTRGLFCFRDSVILFLITALLNPRSSFAHVSLSLQINAHMLTVWAIEN